MTFSGLNFLWSEDGPVHLNPSVPAAFKGLNGLGHLQTIKPFNPSKCHDKVNLIKNILLDYNIIKHYLSIVCIA